MGYTKKLHKEAFKIAHQLESLIKEKFPDKPTGVYIQFWDDETFEAIAFHTQTTETELVRVQYSYRSSIKNIVFEELRKPKTNNHEHSN